MFIRKNTARSLVSVTALAAIGALLLGCVSVGDVANAMGKQNQPAPDKSASQQQPQAQQQQPQQQPSGATFAYKMQFGAFYGAMWSFGWFGYKDANYKPGQGTVWQITSSRGSKEPTMFERAFLKVNADKSQWWRLKFQGGNKKDEIVYEFLVGADTQVQKVRFKDPDSGQVQEFVPDQSSAQQGYTPAQPTRDQLAKSLVGTESVTVRAGTFTADHYRYIDPKSSYTGDSWITKTVPGLMVKFMGTNQKKEATASGELVQIENGVTTLLGSF
ncbi:MAG TPA: hypothetical protein VMV03_11015 [Spirochaetia bacterium]|nr:hypothetical protein [Spirochaetia bacterium]